VAWCPPAEHGHPGSRVGIVRYAIQQQVVPMDPKSREVVKGIQFARWQAPSSEEAKLPQEFKEKWRLSEAVMRFTIPSPRAVALEYASQASCAPPFLKVIEVNLGLSEAELETLEKATVVRASDGDNLTEVFKPGVLVCGHLLQPENAHICLASLLAPVSDLEKEHRQLHLFPPANGLQDARAIGLVRFDFIRGMAQTLSEFSSMVCPVTVRCLTLENIDLILEDDGKRSRGRCRRFFVHNIDPVLVGDPPMDCDARIREQISPATLFGNATKGDLVKDFCSMLARKEKADNMSDGDVNSTRQPEQLIADVQIDRISVALVQIQVIIGVPFTRALKDNSGLQGIAKRLQAYYTENVSA
jgi:hypothetical protein